MSIGACGASCAASTSSRAPFSWATRAISATRPDLAGHVLAPVTATRCGSSQCGRSLERRREALQHLGRRLGDRQIAHADPLPWQQVGVVLAGEGDDVGALGERAGKQVDRVGRVAGDDHRVVVAGIDEAPNRFARALVGGGRGPRLEPRAAVDARVPAEQLLDGIVDGLQRRRRGGVVEVDVAPRPAGHQRHLDVGTDQAQRLAAVDDRAALGWPSCAPSYARGLEPRDGRWRSAAIL